MTSNHEAQTLPEGHPSGRDSKTAETPATGASKANRSQPKKKASRKPFSKKARRTKESQGARKGSKTAKVLELLKRSSGASLKELMKTTGWQAHSVRGFLSGTIGKKMALAVTSEKGQDGERRYSVKA